MRIPTPWQVRIVIIKLVVSFFKFQIPRKFILRNLLPIALLGNPRKFLAVRYYLLTRSFINNNCLHQLASYCYMCMPYVATSMGASIYTKGVDYMQLATLHTLKVNYISQSHHYSSYPIIPLDLLPCNLPVSLNLPRGFHLNVHTIAWFL